MSYELSILEKTGYLHFRVTGENTAENVQRYLQDVLLTCVERNCSNVLIEEDLHGPGLKITEIFQIAEKGSLDAQKYIRKLAYVDTNLQHSDKDMDFAGTVARNRGLFIRIFAVLSDAEAWLSEANIEPE